MSKSYSNKKSNNYKSNTKHREMHDRTIPCVFSYTAIYDVTIRNIEKCMIELYHVYFRILHKSRIIFLEYERCGKHSKCTVNAQQSILYGYERQIKTHDCTTVYTVHSIWNTKLKYCM